MGIFLEFYVTYEREIAILLQLILILIAVTALIVAIGISKKLRKIIKEINNLTCKKCLQNVTGKLIKEYDYFHFFFIPIFKWHEEYYLLCENCNRVFKVSEEKGKSIENGNDINIDYWDLKEEGNIYGDNICQNCGRKVDPQYSYCPYCGNKIK